MNAMPRMFAQPQEENFNLTQLFQSYVSKPEITALSPSFLVKGSANVLLDYAQRVISRNGYTLYNQANTGGGGIKGSYEWETSTGTEISLRSFDHSLQFDWNSTYNTLLSNLRSPVIEFAKVLDYSEQQDVLLFVLSEPSMRRWSGGVSKVRSSTSTTLTKQGVLTSVSTIAFVAGDGVTIPATITDSAAQFLNAGFAAGDSLYVTGSTGNSSNFTIASVTAGVITLIMSDALTAEVAGPSITMYNQTGPTWKSARFFSTISGRAFMYNGVSYIYNGGEATDTLTGITAATGQLIGTTTITNATPAVATKVAHGLVAGDQIFFTSTGALPAGLAINTPYFVIAAGLTADTFEVSATSGGAAINTTNAGSGTHTTYKVTPFPSVVAGDPVWQTPDTINLPSAITTPYPTFYPDLIGVQLNMVFLASTKHQIIVASKNIDYTNFTLTTPRAAGDPVQQPLTSGPATCIVPIDSSADVLNAINTLVFGSGLDAFDQIDFHMSQDNSAELLRIIRYKTAQGSGLISKGAICPIKKNTIYISNEPALDSFSQAGLEGLNGKPISDPIKNDFDDYDFTNAHLKYWKRSLYITVPAEGVVLIYDLMRNLWQPPQTIPISRFAIIQDELYGHSAVTNETYKLFVGTDDNGIFIPQVARFAYNNGGNRARLKNLSEYWSDGYITASGELNLNVYFGFDGSAGIRSMTILGNDSEITTSLDATPLGNEPLGVVPFGGEAFNPVTGLPGAGVPLLRFWQIDTIDTVDYVEHFVEYRMNTLGGQFAIVAHGSDQSDAGTAAITHKK